jgi:hypothetical protein
MLPQANQVRKAIWEAVNPKTGKRRIDEAFPDEICAAKRDSDMFIRFKSGSSWQCLGSDNYEGAIGSTPAGIVYSEWPQANPSSRGYLRPILAENQGWQLYIGTPRGKNHGYQTYRSAVKNKNAYAELLRADETGVFTKEQLEIERQEYIDTYGSTFGSALYEQEYNCSFDAAILGAIWGDEIRIFEQDGRFTEVPHDPDYPVSTAWDIGRTDATAVWWYQVISNEVRVIDFHQATLKDPDYFASQILGKDVSIDLTKSGIKCHIGHDLEGLDHRREYTYKRHWLPHDAKAKTFQAKGKSLQQQLQAAVGDVRITPNLSKQDQRQAGRKLWRKVVMDYRCEEGLEACKQYRYEWDDDKKKFRDNAVHDWTSHPADAWMYLGIAYRVEPLPEKTVKPKKDAYGFDEDFDDWKLA